jgi:peptidoglycan/LPS O-acetylase OafA/YrhL
MSDGSSTVPSQSRHVGALDGLRGFAVLLVFCVHAAGNAATVVAGLDLGHASFLALATWPQRLLFWLQRSHHGVFLFFVLSGYLIGRMWWPQLQLSYAQFAWRRTLRIYPAFLLAFVASLLFVQSGGSTTSLAGARLAGNLLFLNGAPGSSVEPLNIVTWSLFYEMTFYLVFPLLVLAAMRASARAVQWVPVVGILAPIACVQAGADTLVLCWSLLFGGVALAFWRDAGPAGCCPSDGQHRRVRRGLGAGDRQVRGRRQRDRGNTVLATARAAGPHQLLVLPAALDDRGAACARRCSACRAMGRGAVDAADIRRRLRVVGRGRNGVVVGGRAALLSPGTPPIAVR